MNSLKDFVLILILVCGVMGVYVLGFLIAQLYIIRLYVPVILGIIIPAIVFFAMIKEHS